MVTHFMSQSAQMLGGASQRYSGARDTPIFNSRDITETVQNAPGK